MVKLVIVKNPFSTWEDRIVKDVMHGTTLGEAANLAGFNGIEINCCINGEVVAMDENYVIPDNHMVVLSPVVGKMSQGAKTVLSIVAMVGLSIATGGITAGGWQGALGDAFAKGTFGAYAAAAAVMFVGSLLIGRLAGTGTSADSQQDATYSWGGVQTTEGQNNPITMTYGKVKSGGQTIGKFVSTDDDKEYLNWLISAGEGPLEITDVSLNDNPVSYYEGCSLEIREGANDQEIIPYFNDSYFTKNLGYQLVNDERIDTAQGTATQGLIVKFEFSQGLYHANKKGKLENARVTVGAWYRKKGNTAWTQFVNEQITAKSSSAVRREFRIDNLDPAEYEVKTKVIERQYEVTSTSAATRCWWTSLTSIAYDDFIYPGIALIGIRALATDQISGSPNLTFIKERKTVWVWNPYDYEYQEKPANNPAWASYDMLHLASKLKNINTGQYEFEVRGVSANHIIFEHFNEWAQFCEDKNMSVNIEITEAGEMLECINNNIANCGRGVVLRFGTRYGCTWECAKQPVQMFGMGNIIAGTFSEEFLPVEERANCVEITYTDAAQDYNRNVITIYSDEYDTDPAAKTAQATYNGITSYEQAYREGKYQLFCNKYQIRTVSFDASIDAIACNVGDVILVAHDVPQWAYSGRIEGVNLTTHRLTLPVEIENPALDYRLLYRSLNDKLREHDITIVRNENGWCEVELLGTIDADNPPVEHTVFDLAIKSVGSKPFIVKTITRSQTYTRKIECLEYNENVYNEIYNVPPIDYSVANTRAEDVRNLSAKQIRSVDDDGVTEYRLDVSWEYEGLENSDVDAWSKSTSASVTFDVYGSYDGENFTVLARSIKNRSYYSVEVSEVQKVRVVTRNNIMVSNGVVTDVTTKDEIGAPSTPNNINCSIGDMFTVSWAESSDAIVQYYEVRTNTNVGAVDGLIARTTDTNCSTNLITARRGTIYVYAVGVTGKYDNPATKVYEFLAPSAPTFTVDAGLKTVTLSCSNLPANSKAIRYNLVGATHSYEVTTSDSIKVVGVDSDVYTVKAKFVDYFGVGAESTKNVTVKNTIDVALLENESITTDKLQKSINNALALANSSVQPSTLGDYATINALTQTSTEFTNLLGKYTKGDGYLIPVDTHAGSKSSSSIGATITKTSNAYYWQAIYSVTEGAVYNIVCQTYATSIYHVVYTDDDNKIIAREYNSGKSQFYASSAKYNNYDVIEGYVTVPAGVTRMWVTARANVRNTDQDWSACIKVRKATSVYSTISQLNDAIGLQVVNNNASVDGDKLIAAINLGQGTVAINGKYVHISGDTVFDDNVTVKGTWNGNAIAANKIAADSLEAISGTFGHLKTAASGARLELGAESIPSLFATYDDNNQIRVKLGKW